MATRPRAFVAEATPVSEFYELLKHRLIRLDPNDCLRGAHVARGVAAQLEHRGVYRATADIGLGSYRFVYFADGGAVWGIDRWVKSREEVDQLLADPFDERKGFSSLLEHSFRRLMTPRSMLYNIAARSYIAPFA